MKIRYIFPTLLFIAVVFDLWLYLPSEKQKSPVLADSFSNTVNSPNRTLTTDLVAKEIIKGNPIIFLVDVRTQEEFDNYSIPGAINIPLKELPPDDWKTSLNQDVLDIVFYSNDDILSEKAWILCKQQGPKNIYVLDGGLNKWFETIIEPKIPDETASTSEFELFSFRMGASIHFGDGITATACTKSDPSKKKPSPVINKMCNYSGRTRNYL